VEIVKQINEHSVAQLKGIISKHDAQAYRDLVFQDDHMPVTITAVADNGETATLFQGVATNVGLKDVAEVVTMTVDAKSGSYLMDLSERFRSFQDPGATLPHVLELLGAPYADYGCVLKTGGRSLRLGQFTVQYWETDWEFAKRLASRLNTLLVPADEMSGVRFYFGVPHLKEHVLDDSADHTFALDSKAISDKVSKGLKDADAADALSYVVQRREIFAVGDIVKFHKWSNWACSKSLRSIIASWVLGTMYHSSSGTLICV